MSPETSRYRFIIKLDIDVDMSAKALVIKVLGHMKYRQVGHIVKRAAGAELY